jgi:2-succinyl-5-enolpyruvyl-6-hydroxy-3-cyclohexene-1-carboxylate synthase
VNPATERARGLLAELTGAGVRHVVLCPGSRSAPLAYAAYDLAQAGRIQLHVRHDERVAGFVALGVGRAGGVPAAVVTTSGTAVANLHPAVLEAHHGGVPLVVLSADRPPRLRGTWANQTSDLQSGIFGAGARFTADLTGDDPPESWAGAARRAVSHAQGQAGRRPGPTHLNLGFDEPLLPEDDTSWLAAPEQDRDDASWSMTFEGSGESPVGLATAGRTVVLAGDGATSWARRLADRLGVPLLAEPTSGARSGSHAVGPYRLLLDQPDLGGRIERVIVTGRPTLSRPVTRLLARDDIDLVLVQRYADEPGPSRADATLVRPGASTEEALAAAQRTGAEPAAWAAAWARANRAAAEAVDEVLAGWPGLSGPLVAGVVVGATRPDDQLVLAASNPIRDTDLTRPPAESRGRWFANRGVSGIDGTVSTAIGVALANSLPTRVLVGDVALLHDLGALVLGPQEHVPDLTVVVLNDAGGGIFSVLEQGRDAERGPASAARFERVFGTPHAVDLAGVCAAMGVPHVLVGSAAALVAEVTPRPQGLRVVEVLVDRADLRPLHAALSAAVRAAVGPVVGSEIDG